MTADLTLPASGFFHVRHSALEIGDAHQDRAAARAATAGAPHLTSPIEERAPDRRRTVGAGLPSLLTGAPAGIARDAVQGPPGCVERREFFNDRRDGDARRASLNPPRRDVSLELGRHAE